MNKKGFTLIELLIVIAIIGILLGIALPSYQAHIQKGNRIAAQLALTKIAQEFERESARQGDYPTGQVATDIITALADTIDTYSFAASTATTSSFEITATRMTNGVNKDDECGSMSINQAGQTTASLTNCW